MASFACKSKSHRGVFAFVCKALHPTEPLSTGANRSLEGAQRLRHMVGRRIHMVSIRGREILVVHFLDPIAHSRLWPKQRVWGMADKKTTRKPAMDETHQTTMARQYSGFIMVWSSSCEMKKNEDPVAAEEGNLDPRWPHQSAWRP